MGEMDDYYFIFKWFYIKVSIQNSEEPELLTFRVPVQWFGDTTKSLMEWIAKSSQSTVWVRAKGLDVLGIKEPTRMSFFALHALDALTNFDKNDNITIFSIQKKKNIFLRAEGRIQLKYLCSVLR